MKTLILTLLSLLAVGCSSCMQPPSDTERLMGEVLEAIGNHHQVEQRPTLRADVARTKQGVDVLYAIYCIMQYYGKTDLQKAHSFCCTEQALRSTKSRLGKKLDLSLLAPADTEKDINQ